MTRCFGRRRFLFIPLIIAGLAGFGYLTMVLWNALMPLLFHLPLITFWQAAGLLILTRLLFGFGGHRPGMHPHGRNPMREKWQAMNPEEREEFMRNWHQHRPWHSRCKDSATGQEAAENKGG